MKRRLFALGVGMILVSWHLVLHLQAYAQALPPITSSGLNTQISGALAVGGKTQYNITGGMRPGGGTNLFHSFGNFNIPTNNIANFLNDSGLPTSNILGRVTGGNPSSIFGTIQTTGFGNANLFLMNPAGFLFGPNATLNVGGMMAFTTADYLRFQGTQTLFDNASTSQSLSQLTSAPVAAFGFLGSNAAAIAIQGSKLQVAQGQGISLVGGNRGFIASDPDTGNPIPVPGGVTMTGGKLLAPGGQINIASVGGPGEISAVDYTSTAGMTMGNISLSQGALVDVSAEAAGTVRIRGGQLIMDTAVILADTIDGNGASVAIDIQVTDNVSISNVDVPALTARTTGAGNAGEIKISSGSLNVASTFNEASFFFPAIDTHTSGSGNAGNVSIDTGNLTVTGDPNGAAFFIDTGTSGPTPGRGGDVTITAKNVDLQSTGVTTGNFFASFLDGSGAGQAGNVTITADSLKMGGQSQIITDSIDFVNPVGNGGSITVNARNINLDTTAFTSVGEHAGTITITADHFFANLSTIITQTGDRAGGGISFSGKTLELTNASNFVSTTFGNGDAGPISVVATDHISFSGASFFARPSGLFSSTSGNPTIAKSGSAGDIFVTTPRLEMIGGARIDSSTATSGHGGNVIINASNSISISGEAEIPSPEPIFNLGSLQASGIYTRTVGGQCLGPCGNAGNISITTGILTLGSGGQINSGTSTTGQGGDITIHASDSIALSGTLSDGTPVGIFSRTIGTDPGSGNGGIIALHAPQFQINNGAQISANTLGPGNAGNVTIEGTTRPAQSVLIDGVDSGVFTDTSGTGAGGHILVNANSVTLQDGGTLSAKTSGAGNGGTIEINADVINLAGFATINTLTFLGDGSAGNIALKATQQITATDSFLNSDAVAGTGHGGNIMLSSPTISLNGALLSTSTTGTGNAGSILIDGQQISLGASPSAAAQGTDLLASTNSSGQGGTIAVRGLGGPSSYAEDVTIAGNSKVHTVTSGDGSAGDVSIQTARFTLSDFSTLNADTFGSGRAGTIAIMATDSATISGLAASVSSTSDFGATGNAGQITISAPTVLIQNGGLISTSTAGEGSGGNVNISTSSSVTMTNGAKVSASSTGTGTAGNITINAGNQFTMTGSSVTTEANQSSGGAIKITTNPNGSVQLTNSMISASVLDGNGGGGSVNIDPQSVVLQNSQILANAVFGPGGNINITTNLLLPDSTSVISASSQFGQQGNIFIQSPISPASGKIVPLGQKPLLPTTLLGQRCAALAGGSISSFTIAGRDSLPAEPGGWLSNPLALTISRHEDGATKEADRGMTNETPLLSLRRIAPAGFLTQAYAVDWSDNCT